MSASKVSLLLTALLIVPALAESSETNLNKNFACQEAEGRIVGTVKSFDEKRGFGLIQPDRGGPDVFVHITEVNHSHMKTLKVGDRLVFRVGDGGNSTAAQDLARCN
jgi:CspA family cold shock protein